MKSPKTVRLVFDTPNTTLRNEAIASYQQGWQLSIQLNLQLQKEHTNKIFRYSNK